MLYGSCFDPALLPWCRRSADEEWDLHAYPFHLPGNENHFVQGRRDQAGQTDNVRLFSHCCFEYSVRRAHHSQIDNSERRVENRPPITQNFQFSNNARTESCCSPIRQPLYFCRYHAHRLWLLLWRRSLRTVVRSLPCLNSPFLLFVLPPWREWDSRQPSSSLALILLPGTEKIIRVISIHYIYIVYSMENTLGYFVFLLSKIKKTHCTHSFKVEWRCRILKERIKKLTSRIFEKWEQITHLWQKHLASTKEISHDAHAVH